MNENQFIVTVKRPKYPVGWLYLVTAESESEAITKTQIHLDSKSNLWEAKAEEVRVASARDIADFNSNFPKAIIL